MKYLNKLSAESETERHFQQENPKTERKQGTFVA